jgi:dihydroxyacetone kinase-like protein
MVKNTLVIEWFRRAFLSFEKNASYLTELDAQIGDADHGVNMLRGFQKVNGLLPQFESQEIGAILKTAGMALVGSVGGASGPLYGTFFLDAAKAAGTSRELSDDAWSKVLEAGVAGIRRIGKAQAGDKTMLDALQPGLDAFHAAVSQGKSLLEASGAMVVAAAQGRDSTTPMLARKGRASYLGERSVGHMDPGAASVYILLGAFAAAVSGELAEKP